MFHDREEGLETLRGLYGSRGFSLVIVYGRRRVGKTELLKKSCEDDSVDSFYHLATQDSETVQRERLVGEIASERDERTPRTDDWRDAVDYLGETLSEDGKVVIIDEFPYLVESDETVLSELQWLVDERLNEPGSTLVLCGSSIGVMESKVMGHESPLYGRRTAQMDIQPFGFENALEVIRHGEGNEYDFEEAVRSFAATGGTPMYLTAFNYDEPLKENLLKNHLSKNSVLHNEPEFLLRTELRNPSRYMSVLEAVAEGYTTPNEISGQTGIDTGPLSQYLQKLRRLRLVEREIPVTAEEKKSKRSIYKIADEFLRFWFRFVEPNRSGIEQTPELVLENEILPNLDGYVSETFEDVCEEALWKLSRSGELDGSYSKIGRWWYGGDEIDIVGLDSGKPAAVFCECKWTASEVGEGVARRLEEKAGEVRWRNGKREEEFVLFSRSGFEDGLSERLGDEWRLYGLEDMRRVFER
jgi:AAA+ ATPase superfamily predicted ATPase